MYPRFVLPAEKEYNKMFAGGTQIYIYPSSKEDWTKIEKVIINAISNNKQLSKEHIENTIGKEYSNGYAKWLIVIKVI